MRPALHSHPEILPATLYINLRKRHTSHAIERVQFISGLVDRRRTIVHDSIMTSLNPYHVKQCKGKRTRCAVLHAQLHLSLSQHMRLTRTAYLSVLYPQFSTNEIEITAASRQNQHPGYTKPHTIWFVAVWVKRAVDEQPAARLLEAGPELATPEMALKTYIEQCLQPAINALTAQHLLSTPMTRKGHGVCPCETWKRGLY